MPTIRFSQYAWDKMSYLASKYNHEIGCFGLSAEDDPLLIIDVLLPKQKVSVAAVDFDDDDLAEFVECHIRNFPLERFFRIWIHTHPNMSSSPSGTDNKTFLKIFSNAEWAAMVIFPSSQKCPVYGELWIKNLGLHLTVDVGCESIISEEMKTAWEREVEKKVKVERIFTYSGLSKSLKRENKPNEQLSERPCECKWYWDGWEDYESYEYLFDCSGEDDEDNTEEEEHVFHF